ncbi:MAG: HDOD domain-containing protein [Candidatus Krumholzibacteriia bacterium]
MPIAATGRRNEKGWRSVNLDVLQRIDDLPSLSSVVAEFLELTRREYFTAKDFETVISKDQALVARLLKVANSAMYGRPRRIHSIAESVVLVGLDQMKRIVFSVSTEGLTRTRLKNYAYESNRGYWMHSTAVGLAARAIIDVLPQKPLHGEEAFVAGLLHDVGKLIIDDFLDAEMGPRRVTREEEIAAIGLDHAELAEYILGQWKLPESIVESIRDHHCGLDDAGTPAGARLLQLAEAIVCAWRVGEVEEIDLSIDFDPEPHRALLASLGLTDPQLPQVIWDVRQNLAGIEKLYA